MVVRSLPLVGLGHINGERKPRDEQGKAGSAGSLSPGCSLGLGSQVEEQGRGANARAERKGP